MSINLGAVGTAFVDIQVDLSNLQGALSNAVQDAGNAGAKVGAGFSRGVNEGLAPVGDSIKGIGPLFDGIGQKAGIAAQQIGFDFNEAESIVVSSSESMAQAVVASSETMGGAVQQTGGYFQNLKQSFANFGEALGPALERLDSFRPMLTSIGSQAQGLGTMLSIGVTAPILALGVASVKAFGDIDSLKRGLTAVAGSAAEADSQFKDMIEVAKLPGLGLEEATKGSISLQAFGFSAAQSKEALLAFGNAIATVGGGKGELDGVIRQLGQMAGAGRVLTQDLRPIIQQVPQVATVIKAAFGDDIISEPAKRLDALGITTQQFIQRMITDLGKLPPVTGGIKNDLENFSDAMTRDLAKVGESLAPLVHAISEVLVPVVDEMVNAFTSLPVPLQGVGIALAGLAAVIGPALIVFGSMSRGLADIIGIAKTFNDMRIASTAVEEMATAAKAADVAMTGAAAAETLMGTSASAAAVEVGLMSDAELLAAKSALALDGALKGSALVGTLIAFGEALAILAGAAGVAAIIPALVSLLDPLKKTHVEMNGAALATHDMTAEVAKATDAWGIASTFAAKLADGHMILSKAAQEDVAAQAELRKAYAESVQAYNQLLQQQKEGKDVAVALALAHDDMTKSYKALNPQIAENEKATKAATEARKAASEVANKADADALKIFDEAKKRETELQALQSSGVDVTKSLKQAKDDLSKAFIALNATTYANAQAQNAANAGTEQAAAVAQRQQENLFKVSEAARQYVAAMQASSIATLDHEIALQRVVGVLIDGVTYIHSFSDEQVKAAAAGKLSWKEIQDAVLGVTTSIKMVPQVVDVAAVSMEQLAQGATASLGDLSGAVIAYEGQIAQSTTLVTDHLAAVRILRGEGVQHIQTLSDEIGKMGKQWITATEALNGNKAVIPKWVQDNTLAIVNGVRIVSDAAAAAHSTADGLKTGLDGVATGMENVGSHSGSAVAGINRVADAASRAASSMSSYQKDLAGMGATTLASQGMGDDSFKPSNFLPEGQSQSSSFNAGSFNPNPLTAQGGDIRSIQNVFTLTGGMVINIQTWLQSQIDGIKALMATGMAQSAAEILAESGLGVQQAAHIMKLRDEAAAQQAAAAATSAALKVGQAQADQVKIATEATAQAKLSLGDLNDELWSLIDAGQGNSNAAYQLRQQINALGSAAQVTSNAFSDTIDKTAAFSSAMGDLASTAVAATQQAVAVTTQARSAGIGGDPFAATKPLTLPSVPSSTAQMTYTPLTNVGGKLIVMTPPPIVIQQVSPEQTGQDVTDILRRAALQ